MSVQDYGAKYSDARYSQSLYGRRVRQDFDLKVVPVDYGRVRIEIPQIPDLPPGSEVVLVRGGWYYPAPPGASSPTNVVWSHVQPYPEDQIPTGKDPFSDEYDDDFGGLPGHLPSMPDDPDFVVVPQGSEPSDPVDLSSTHAGLVGVLRLSDGSLLRGGSLPGAFVVSVLDERGREIGSLRTSDTVMSFSGLLDVSYLLTEGDSFVTARIRVTDTIGAYPDQFYDLPVCVPYAGAAATLSPGQTTRVTVSLSRPEYEGAYVYDRLPEGSVAHYRLYVREPGKGFVPLPWDSRAEASCVVPRQSGGEGLMATSIPNTFLADGSVYGEPDLDGPTYSLLETSGFLYDSLVGLGESVYRDGFGLNPAMVLPMLRAFGMTDAEERFFSVSAFGSTKAKTLLYRYRSLMSGKGTEWALAEYMRLVTGIDVTVSQPENLLNSGADSSPDSYVDGVEQSPGRVRNGSVEVVGSKWKAVNESPLAAISDPWVDDRESFGLRYEHHCAWHYRLLPKDSAVARLRTVHEGSQPDPRTCVMVLPGVPYFFRCRVRNNGSETVDVTLSVTWLDKDGKVLSTDAATNPSRAGGWEDRSLSCRAPNRAYYAAWGVSVVGAADVSVGAIHLSDTDFSLVVDDECPEPFRFYRDPRSVVVRVEYGSGDPLVDEKYLVGQFQRVLAEFLPFSVNYRVLESTSTAEWENLVRPEPYVEPRMDSLVEDMSDTDGTGTEMDNPPY